MSIDELEETISCGGQFFSNERFEEYLKLALEAFEEEQATTPVNLTQKKAGNNA